MFWESVTLPSEITEESTLEDVLNDDYILQRCRERNPKLCGYLKKSKRISQLIELVTDQSDIVFNTIRFKHPSVAAEILSSNLPTLLDALVSPRKLSSSSSSEQDTSSAAVALPFVDNLLSFIDTPLPLNSLSASFFSKIMINLLLHRAEVLVPYLKSKTSFFPNLLRHMETSAICDLVIELAQQDNGQQHLVPKWFLEAKLIDRLLEGLSSDVRAGRDEYSARCLTELMSIYRNYVACNAPEIYQESIEQASCASDSKSNCDQFDTVEEKTLFDGALAILNELESEKFLGALLDVIIHGPTRSSSIISNCVEVFLSAIEKTKSSAGLPPGAGEEFNENPFDLATGFFPACLPGRQFTNRLASKANCPLLQQRARLCEVNAANAAISRLPELYAMLQSNVLQNYNFMPTTVGVLPEPLGKVRLCIVNLISALCQLNDDQILEAICKQGFLLRFMELFEAYPYNSFLHHAVTETFKHLLNPKSSLSNDDSDEMRDNESQDKDTKENNNHVAANSSYADPVRSAVGKLLAREPNVVIRRLTQDCNIIDWILRLSCLPRSDSKPQADNEGPSTMSAAKPKPGFSGHLWEIANSVAGRFPSTDMLNFDGSCEGLPTETASRWDKFVNEDLAEINEIQMAKIEMEPEESSEPTTVTLSSLQQKDLQDILKLLRGPTLPEFRTTTSAVPESAFLSYPSSGEVNDDTDSKDVDSLMLRSRGPVDKEDFDYVVDDEEDVNYSSTMSSSDDEEDLESPVSIPQQRCNSDRLIISGASILGQVNGLVSFDSEPTETTTLVKPVNTSIQPWSNDSNCSANSENDKPAPFSATVTGATSVSGEDHTGWANFESASFEQSTFQAEKPLETDASLPTDSVRQC